MERAESTDRRHRIKTAQRLKYESESRVIRESLGGIEGIRQRLAMTQRQICQLLMVDPSAWSRWVKDESKVPPHILRALQWYTELESKDSGWKEWREWAIKRDRLPEWDVWRRQIEKRLNQGPVNAQVMPPPQSVASDQTQSLGDFEKENFELRQRAQRAETLGVAWKILLLLNTAWLLWSLFGSGISFR